MAEEDFTVDFVVERSSGNRLRMRFPSEISGDLTMVRDADGGMTVCIGGEAVSISQHAVGELMRFVYATNPREDGDIPL